MPIGPPRMEFVGIVSQTRGVGGYTRRARRLLEATATGKPRVLDQL